MSAERIHTAVKFHVSLNVSDLPRSVQFYGALFGVEPTKRRSDYAKFELDVPPLILSLIPGRPGPSGSLNHLGLRVSRSEDLVAIQHRLEAAGSRTQREEGVECCYAKQTKFWATDPDRALWEIYLFHEDMDEAHEHDRVESGQVESFAKDVPSEKVIWQHQILEPVPVGIPLEDNSVHEVILEGTLNLKPDSGDPASLVAEAFRVLRPGGNIQIHGLASDAALPDVPLSLPGPAVAVKHVPTVTSLTQLLRCAGFVQLRFEKLSARAYFEVAGVGLREILLLGGKPGHRTSHATHTVVYLGPLAQTIDDFGNLFVRGERVMLNVHDWQALKNSTVAHQFLLLAPNPTPSNANDSLRSYE